jgi:HAD superfamily hydrolase (TIGR01549 family)
MRITADKDIKAIYFDQGGVVMGARVPLPDNGEANLNKIMRMTGLRDDYIKFMDRLLKGEDKYKKWGMDSLIECTADKVWPGWMLPEIPEEILTPIAEELTLLYFESKGKRTADKNIKDVLIELKKREYIVGLISNTWSKALVHQELKEGGLEGLFDTVVLSSEEGIRKPDKEIFLRGLAGFNIKPENAVYVGDQPNRDIPGPRNAGFALSIILKTKKLKSHHMEKPEHNPDLIIDSLTQLLDIFPDR